jgi:deoxyribonuclease V
MYRLESTSARYGQGNGTEVASTHIVSHQHPWDLSPREAVALQSTLAQHVIRRGDLDESRVRTVAGADVAFDKPNGRAVGAVVLLAYPSLDELERVIVESPVTFPYVPGLLSFRETPVLLGAFERLRDTPDLLMVDGHGYAHPRRFGFACHLGLLLDLPTIGVAKSRLVGEQGTVAGPRGARADLTHEGEVIGSMVRTRQGVRSMYVSIGHRLSLAAAERWALACARGYRVPEPTRRADRVAGEAKRRMLDLTLRMVIEQRAGERGRWEWVAADDAVVFCNDLVPMPTHYGCSIDIINPADGQELDVMLLEDTDRARNEKLSVRVVDVLERSDGDHKLLALPVDAEPYAPATQRRLARARDDCWRFYTEIERPITHWGGEDRALEIIEACRGGAT